MSLFELDLEKGWQCDKGLAPESSLFELVMLKLWKW